LVSLAVTFVTLMLIQKRSFQIKLFEFLVCFIFREVIFFGAHCEIDFGF